MIRSVSNYPISQLLDIDAKLVYVIPKYQREYTWGKEQWENLFDDILENATGYFLGSIICINQAVDVLDVQQLEVVDGQQRLTTISLLFAAIYQALRERETHLDEDQRYEMMNLKRKLVLRSTPPSLRVVLQVQNHNLDDYRSVLGEIGIIDAPNRAAWGTIRKIIRAFRYFVQRINQLTEGSSNGVPQILELLTRINQSTMVKIEVVSHADAYILFESLNDRGMPLTAVDLIKNKLLAKLEASNGGGVEDYFERWTTLLNYLGDDYSVQERFFRQYYNAFKDELNASRRQGDERRRDPLGSVATRSNLMYIYEKLINDDPRGCLRDLLHAGRLYAGLLDRAPGEIPNIVQKSIRDLGRIQGAPAYVLMLYLLKYKSWLQLQNEHLLRIVNLLVAFFVRRNLTDTPPTRDLTRLFMAIIDELSELRGASVVDCIHRQLVTVSASAELFRSKLSGPIYEENAGVTRFVLCSLAEQAMTQETWVDLWKTQGKLHTWTVEHIFPQGENIPDAWVSMIADGDRNRATEIQDQYVHVLGNLTMSGYNSTLSNKSFVEKRDRVDSEGRYIGYKNNLKLNEDLASVESWSVEQIQARTNKLVGQVMLRFKLIP